MPSKSYKNNTNMISECTKFYGENRNYKFSILFINQTCEKFNGSCLVGCKNGEECYSGSDF